MNIKGKGSQEPVQELTDLRNQAIEKNMVTADTLNWE